ncbi:MAG: diguanylate cyclase [Alkalispirochaeta sp.]
MSRIVPAMNLKLRFSIITGALLLIASLLTYVTVRFTVVNIVEEWGRRVVEIQVLNDTARILRPLEREILLARQMARSGTLERWSVDPDDPDLERAAIEEMEQYRQMFRSENYFVALRRTGGYYHNNADEEYTGRELRYHLSPDRAADAWFYRLIEDGLDFHLNVNPDIELGITSLWIDVLMREGGADDGEILGVVGTGIPLGEFLTEILDIHDTGVTTLFLDRSGAIQLYRDPRMIDYGSFVKPEGQKRTVDLLFSDSRDSEEIYRLMEELQATSQPGAVRTVFVEIDGTQKLAGLTYLPTIGWFEISLLDMQEVMPVGNFARAIVLFVVVLVLALLGFNFFLRREVLYPVGTLQREILRFRNDSRYAPVLPAEDGEIGELMKSFAGMAEVIRRYTTDLEEQVEARTAELIQMSRTDPLTGLLNRRGMNETMREQRERSIRTREQYGIVSIDLDRFKEINDTFGHAAGDRTLEAVARIFNATVRPYDHVARWGGDEFLILVAPATHESVQTVTERILDAIRNWDDSEATAVGVSIGATIAAGEEDLDRVLQRADEVLYRVKRDGRGGAEIAPGDGHSAGDAAGGGDRGADEPPAGVDG